MELRPGATINRTMNEGKSSQVCRTCAEVSKGSILIPVFDQIEITTKINNPFQLTDLLLLLNVQIEKDDGLPQQVCIKCVEQLTDFYTFRELCKESQTKLREILLKKEPNSPSDPCAHIHGQRIEKIIEECEVESVEPTSDDGYTNDVKEDDPFSSSSEKNITYLGEVDRDEGDSKTESKKVLPINFKTQNSDRNKLQRPVRICHDCNKYGHSSRYASDRRHCSLLQMNSEYKFQTATDSEFCCFYCDEKFESMKIIQAHILEVHPINNPFNCKICSKYFQSVNKLHAHIEREHEQLEKTEKKEDAEIKNTNAEEKTKHICEFCYKEFKFNSDLKTHRDKVHPNGNFECAICLKKFTNAHKFNYHLKSHDKNKEFKCRYCDKTFIQSPHLHFHEETHINADRPYKCELCERSYVHRYQYKTHLRTHEGNFSHICEICGKGFPANFMLNVHKRSHSLNYQCEFCGKRFNGKMSLDIHRCPQNLESEGQQNSQSKKRVRKRNEYQRRHYLKKKLENKFYTCPLTVCSAKFEIPSALEKHMRVHDKNRKYKCDICHRSYITSNHLKEHINRVHSKIVHYDCSICGKRFYDKCSVNYHVRSHTDKYECKFCHKSYSKKYLKIHELIHTQEENCVCKICGKGFPTLTRLTTHYGKHTSEEKNQMEAEILAKNKDSETMN